MHDTVFNLIIAIVVFGYVFERTLSWLNTKAMSTTLPEELHGVYDDEKYRKSQLYKQ